MSALIAAALVAGLTLGVVGKGSLVRVQTREGKLVFGEVIDENATGITVQNGNVREVISYTDVADLTELGAPLEVGPPPPPPPPDVPIATAPPRPRDDVAYERPEPVVPDPPSALAIRANLADIAFFGPTLGVEYEVVSKLGVLLEARVLNGGLMNALGGPYGPASFGNRYGTYRLWLDAGGGGSAGIVYFLGSRKGLRGFYLGAAAEVLYRGSRLVNDTSFFATDPGSYKPLTVTEWFVAPHARIGVRFRAGPVLIGLGVRGGAGLLAAASASHQGQTRTWGSTERVYLDLSAIFELGFYAR